MAADHEVRLVSKAIRDRDINTLINAGIEQDWWQNSDVSMLWTWLVEHNAQYGEVPSPTTVLAEFPTFTILRVEDSLDYLTDAFVKYRRHTLITDMVQGAAEIMSETNDQEEAKTFVEAKLSEINMQASPGTSDLDLIVEPIDRLLEYDAAAERGDELLGLPTGFAKIDEATGGLEGGQLVTVIATPKTGKSTVALRIATNQHEMGTDLIFQSFEMSNGEQMIRHDAMRAHISHTRLRQRKLTDPERTRYMRMLQGMDGMENRMLLTDSVRGSTVSTISAKIEQYEPAVIYIDGVYLMIDEQTGESNTPQALTNITRSLKRLAQRLDIPVVISTQTLPWKQHGKRPSAEAIGYSSSFFQDSDVILGLAKVEDNDEERELMVVESRNCGKESVNLIWRWDTGCFHDSDPAVIEDCVGCEIAARYGPALP